MTSNPNKIISLQELINAQVDAKVLELIMNEAPLVEVETRLGRKCYSISTIQAIIDQYKLQADVEIANLTDAINVALAAGAGAAGWTASLVVDGDKNQKQINKLVDFKLSQTKSIWDFMTIPELAEEQLNTKAFNWSPIAQRAMDSDYLKIYVPAKKMMHEDPEPYYCDWVIFVRKDKIIKGDGVNVSKFKLFDQSSIYHNPNRSTDKNDKGLGSLLYEDYHAVMVAFTDNFSLEGIGLDANAINNYVEVGGVKYNRASVSNGAGVQRYCHGLVLESAGGEIGDKWRIWASKIESTSYTGILLNHTANVVFKGRFEFESSHITNTHEDSLSYHKVSNFKVWNSSFGNSHSHMNHFYYLVSGGEVHDNYFYLDDSYQNLTPQHTPEKFAFIFGHNDYDLNTCSNVRVFNNIIENKWTRGAEIPHMKLCAASITRTPKNIAFNNNVGRKLYYGVSFSGVPLGINEIIGNTFEYELRGVSFALSGSINTLEDITSPTTPTILFGGNTFKYLGANETVSIGTYHDIRITGNISIVDQAKITAINIIDLGNNFDLGCYLADMTPKINYLQNSKQVSNLIARLNYVELLNGKQFQWLGRGSTNVNTTYTPVNATLDSGEALKGVVVNSTYSGDYPNISGDSEVFVTGGGLHNLSFYAKNLSGADVKIRVEQRVAGTNTVQKVLVSDTSLGLDSNMKQCNFRLPFDPSEGCSIRVQFYGVSGQPMNFEHYGLQVNQGTCRVLTEDQSYKRLESDVIPADTTKKVGTIVYNTNPSTHIGWIYTTAGWKTYGAIT